jgi:radical SAM protein with 4Fe4S-binding SPASM domain
MDKLKAIPVKDIIFSGGEPFLRRDLFDILKLAKSQRYELDICTNGTLLNRERALRLAEYTSEVSISLDGATRETHNSLRGIPQAYDRTLEGIGHLKAAGHTIHVTIVVNRDNYHEVEDMVVLAQRLGVESIAFLGMIENSVNQFPRDSMLGSTELLALKQTISDCRKNYSAITINTKRLFFDNPLEACGAGTTILGIDALGHLLPCILLSRTHLSQSLLTCDISDIFSLPFFREVVGFVAAEKDCSFCLWKPQCKFGCLGATYLAQGTLGPDITCISVRSASRDWWLPTLRF